MIEIKKIIKVALETYFSLCITGTVMMGFGNDFIFMWCCGSLVTLGGLVIAKLLELLVMEVFNSND